MFTETQHFLGKLCVESKSVKNLVAVYSLYLILRLVEIPDQSFMSRVWWMKHNVLTDCLQNIFVC